MTEGQICKKKNMDSVYIANSNYARYGTSVYQHLYGENYHGNNSEGYDDMRQSSYESAVDLELNGSSYVENDNATIVSATSKIKQRYKSLIVSSSKKLKNNYHKTKNHIVSRKETVQSSNEPVFVKRSRGNEVYAGMNEIPVEVLVTILSQLDTNTFNEDLYYCLYVNRNFYKATKMLLYYDPFLTSTYRLGQLVTSLRLYPENGKLIKVLNLSQLKNGLVNTSNNESGVDTGNNNEIDTNTNDDNNEDNNDNVNDNDNENTIHDDEDLLNNTNSSGLSRATTASSSTFTRTTSRSQEIVLATWRDWKHRHDPLYGSTLLNTSNIQKLTLTASLSNSNSNSTTNLSGSNSQSSTSSSSTSFQRLRSNSSASSISGSIMSSFTNSLTPVTSIMTNSTSGTNNLSKSQNKITHQLNVSNKQNSQISNKKQWLKYKLNFKNNNSNNTIFSASLKNTNSSEKISNATTSHEKKPSNSSNSSSSIENSIDESNSNLKVKFAEDESIMKTIIQRQHPRANKFLAKYSSYHDVPVGYILHLLKLCPNLIQLNFSNLVICNDFYVKNKNKKHSKNQLLVSSMTTFGNKNKMCQVINNNKLQDESFIPVRSDYDLETIFLTDSSKSYEYFAQKMDNSSSYHNKSVHGQNLLRSNYPLPIDSSTKYREEYRRTFNNINGNYKLEKINPSEIFEEIIKMENSLEILKNITMNNIIWCREYMVKNFVLSLFLKNENKELNLSFTKSGLNRRVPWATAGSLYDLVALLILDEINQNDDLAIEDMFNIKKKASVNKFKYKKFSAVDQDSLINSTGIFSIEYGNEQYMHTKSLDCKVIFLKSDDPTEASIENVINPSSRKLYTLLTVSLYAKDDISLTGIASTQEFKNKPCKKIDRITRELLSRIRELSSEELRRNMGENNYLLLQL